MTNQPWSAYNWYLGGGRSRIDINTDLPLRITGLVGTIAHEGYAGHHTELSIKDARLLRAQGQLRTLPRVHQRSLVRRRRRDRRARVGCAAVRRRADSLARRRDFPTRRLHPPGCCARTRHRQRACDQLAGVWDNAAFLLHDQHQSKAEVSAYFQRYGLRRAKEADKAVEFLSSPLSRSYVFTYGYGGKLLDALFAAQGQCRSLVHPPPHRTGHAQPDSRVDSPP